MTSAARKTPFQRVEDLTNEFRTSAFEDVQDDLEFLRAISRSG